MIAKNGEYASYIVLKIAADYFKKPIALYRKRFENDLPGEIILPPSIEKNSIKCLKDCVKILFKGHLDRGHYEPILN